MYYLYILKSAKDQKGYMGTTNNLERRLQQHNSGAVRSTKYRRPFILMHSEEFQTLTEAQKREWILKCTPSGGKLKRKILDTAGVAARDA